MGYANAGFEVHGVDLYPQNFYPFVFTEHEALSFLEKNWRDYDAFAASPPCQAHSVTKYIHGGHENIPDQITPTRAALIATGKPYIIENVPQAPLLDPIMLCGAMKEIQEIYPLLVYRHRMFESNMPLKAPEHVEHNSPVIRTGLAFQPDRFVTVAGNFAGAELARRAMGMEWAKTRRGVAQAIPPPYTEYLGKQLIAQL